MLCNHTSCRLWGDSLMFSSRCTQTFQPPRDSHILSRWSKSEKNRPDHGGPLNLPRWEIGLDNFVKLPSLWGLLYPFEASVGQGQDEKSWYFWALGSSLFVNFRILALGAEVNSVVDWEQKITQIQVPWSQLMIPGWVILTPVGQCLFIPHRMYFLSNACRVLENQLMNYSKKIKLPFNI